MGLFEKESMVSIVFYEDYQPGKNKLAIGVSKIHEPKPELSGIHFQFWVRTEIDLSRIGSNSNSLKLIGFYSNFGSKPLGTKTRGRNRTYDEPPLFELVLYRKYPIFLVVQLETFEWCTHLQKILTGLPPLKT